MVSIRFFGFVLVFILVLTGESAADSQVLKRILAAHGCVIEPARKNPAKLGKEVYDAVPAAAEVGNSRLEGRKMMLKWGLDKKTVTVEGSDGEESAKITGKVTNALNNQIGSSQEKFNYQDDRNMLKAKFLSSATPEASRKHSVKLPSRNQLCFQYSKPVSDKGSSECFSRSPKLVPRDSDNSLEKHQSKKLLEAARDLLNFMNEDYRIPPTKPPVHNYEPLDQKQAIP
ncbi:PREDICTED: uncharacterized protein LOC18604918 [Theobroma cacao]|uniref:Uncharacterized protein LOC18604918 n=1 Tax=Theobroma cacao TaxID=3641 RepID=A0AB32W4E6_THECC|nr:PREDICTED: uncharacterized protein LOC18604918 [Theobroma cacao]